MLTELRATLAEHQKRCKGGQCPTCTSLGDALEVLELQQRVIDDQVWMIEHMPPPWIGIKPELLKGEQLELIP